MWAAVALTLISDCRDELDEATTLTLVDHIKEKWIRRATTKHYVQILETLEIDASRVVLWINDYCERIKEKIHQGRLDQIVDVAMEGVRGVEWIGKRKRY